MKKTTDTESPQDGGGEKKAFQIEKKKRINGVWAGGGGGGCGRRC